MLFHARKMPVEKSLEEIDMRRRFYWVMGFLWVLPLLFAGVVSADLGLSKTVLDPSANCYSPGETKTLCFLVTNDSPDGEAITDVDLGFPEDWTVLKCCLEKESCPVDDTGYVRT